MSNPPIPPRRLAPGSATPVISGIATSNPTPTPVPVPAPVPVSIRPVGYKCDRPTCCQCIKQFATEIAIINFSTCLSDIVAFGWLFVCHCGWVCTRRRGAGDANNNGVCVSLGECFSNSIKIGSLLLQRQRSGGSL